MENKYARRIPHGKDHLDVYDVLIMFEVRDQPCSTQHAVKKLLACGQRGHKDALEDLLEARQSIDRAIEIVSTYGEKENGN